MEVIKCEQIQKCLLVLDQEAESTAQVVRGGELIRN